MTAELTILRPDDWHLHVRDGAALRAVVPHSARQFARAIVMPNLKPPVVTVEHVCVLGAEKAAWFNDPEGNILCLHEDLA